MEKAKQKATTKALTKTEVVGELPAHDRLLDEAVRAAVVLVGLLHADHRRLRGQHAEVKVRREIGHRALVGVIAVRAVRLEVLICCGEGSCGVGGYCGQ